MKKTVITFIMIYLGAAALLYGLRSEMLEILNLLGVNIQWLKETRFYSGIIHYNILMFTLPFVIAFPIASVTCKTIKKKKYAVVIDFFSKLSLFYIIIVIMLLCQYLRDFQLFGQGFQMLFHALALGFPQAFLP